MTQEKGKSYKDFNQLAGAMSGQARAQPAGTPAAVRGGGSPPSTQRPVVQQHGQDFWQQYFQYLDKVGYFDESGYLRPELIVDYAQEVADRLGNDGMTRSMLRNFYNEVATIRYLVRQKPSEFHRFKSRILKLRAHAHNATMRRTGKAPEVFFRFIDENTKLASKDMKEFLNGFCEHFECIVLYFKKR